MACVLCCAASCSLFDVSHRGRASGKKSKNFCAKMEKDKAIKPEKEEMQNVRCCASSTHCCCCCSCSVTSRGRRRHERIFNMRLPVVCRPHSACCCCCTSHTHTPAHTQARIKKAKWLLLLLVDMCATNNNN